MKWVLEPGEVTPIFNPQALRPAIGNGFRRHGGEHEAGIAPVLRDRHDRLPLGLHLDSVVEGADAHLGAAADQGLQCARAALHIHDLEFEARLPEVAEPLGHRERQIEDRRFAADYEPQLRHFRLVHYRPVLSAGRRQHHDGGDRDGARQDMLHQDMLHQDMPHIASLLTQPDAAVAAALAASFDATTTKPATAAPFSVRVEA
jgi:hypothetical protein